jgi:hypothetical protein
MMHEESGVGLDPTFSVKAEATAGDDQMDVRMPFHVGAKSVDDNKNAQTHFFDVPSPLLHGFSGSLANKVESCFSIHHDDDAQLPWNGHNQMMIGHV